ncbi:MAG: hypothetical protein Q4B43_02335 [Bacteroidota bacterium]|nr:hypothetical protein [Bacteroidota bacterium]
MKTLYTILNLLFISILTSCSTHIEKNVIASCPENGDCKFYIEHNVGLNINSDNTYNLKIDENKSIVYYKYSKLKNSIYQNDSYSEEIIMEFDKSWFDMDFQNYNPTEVIFITTRNNNKNTQIPSKKDITLSYNKEEALMQININQLSKNQIIKNITIR